MASKEEIEEEIPFNQTREASVSVLEQDILFATSNNTKAQRYLRGDPVSLFITNINTIMGGRNNPWANSEQKNALRGTPMDPGAIYKP